MRKQIVLPKEYEFYFPESDNIVLVECREDESVIIRSTKNNFSDREKVFFIRKLAAEGFIPDDFQWFSDSLEVADRVTWIKDYSWLKIHPTVKRRANRAIALLLIGSAILWIAMMRVVIVSIPPDPAAAQTAKSPPALALSTPVSGIGQNRYGSLVP